MIRRERCYEGCIRPYRWKDYHRYKIRWDIAYCGPAKRWSGYGSGKELKYYDYAVMNYPFNTPAMGGSVLSFSGIPQGTGQSQRVGASIRVRGVAL